MFNSLSFVCVIVTWLVCPRSCPHICEAPWRWQLRCQTTLFAVGSKEDLMCHWEQTYQLVAHWRWQASARTTVVMVAGHAFEETDWLWETPRRWAGRKPSPASLQEFPHPLSKLPSTRIWPATQRGVIPRKLWACVPSPALAFFEYVAWNWNAWKSQSWQARIRN